MKEIFEAAKFEVKSNGFTRRVMQQVILLKRPSKNSYRVPTLIATALSVIAIVVLMRVIPAEQVAGAMTRTIENIRISSLK